MNVRSILRVPPHLLITMKVETQLQDPTKMTDQEKDH